MKTPGCVILVSATTGQMCIANYYFSCTVIFDLEPVLKYKKKNYTYQGKKRISDEECYFTPKLLNEKSHLLPQNWVKVWAVRVSWTALQGRITRNNCMSVKEKAQESHLISWQLSALVEHNIFTIFFSPTWGKIVYNNLNLRNEVIHEKWCTVIDVSASFRSICSLWKIFYMEDNFFNVFFFP